MNDKNNTGWCMGWAIAFMGAVWLWGAMIIFLNLKDMIWYERLGISLFWPFQLPLMMILFFEGAL